MRIGSRSVLYGAHCFFIHPWFVAWAWTKLYGFPNDIRLWCAFFLHDLGYWSLPNMDGPEGEMHPLFAAKLMSVLFDRSKTRPVFGKYDTRYICNLDERGERTDDRAKWRELGYWGMFCILHSRFLAKRFNYPFSRLCVADKLAFALTPRWIYLPMVRATGEIKEYMRLAEQRTEAGEPKFAAQGQHRGDEERWFEQVKVYMARWVEEHADGRPDTWTPASAERKAQSASGVWY